MRIGVPRALLYHSFAPALQPLFASQGAELVLSPPTNKVLLEQGLSKCEEEVCLPVKVMMGHVAWLVDGKVDALFVPRVIYLEKRRYICPKFLGLPDLVRESIAGDIPLISPVINGGWGRLRQWWQAVRDCRPYLKGGLYLWQGLTQAARVQSQCRQTQVEVQERRQPGKKRVVVLGHSYNVHDEYINFQLLSQLDRLGVEVLTVENFRRDQIDRGAAALAKDLFWCYGRDLVGAAFAISDHRLGDGVILVVSFGCGPDSLVKEVIEQRFARADIPLMSVVLDEHSSGTGLATRLEAFVDMLNWRDVV